MTPFVVLAFCTIGFLGIAMTIQLVILTTAALALHGRIVIRSAIKVAVMFALAGTLAVIVGASIDPAVVLSF